MNILHYLELEKRESLNVGYLLKGGFVLGDDNKHFACLMPKRGNTIEDFIDSLRELADGLDDVVSQHSEVDR